nr:ABC transporter ATP-binding protein [Mitsuokella multacida]
MRPRLEARSLCVTCYGCDVLKDVNFVLPAGAALAVIGESGAGKSTLLRTILNSLPDGGGVTGGDLLYEDTSLLSMRKKARQAIFGRDIAIMFQQPGRFLNPIRSIGKQFRDFLAAHGVYNNDAYVLALESLKKAGLEEPERILASYVFQLSGGQRQRVAIAMLRAFSPRLILLDEPTAALDIVAVRELLDVLRLELARGASILLVTHHIRVAAYIANQFLVLKKGRIVEAGGRSEILRHPKQIYTQALLAAVPKLR